MAVDTAPTRQVEARERPAASRFTGFLRERGLLLLGIAFIIVYCLAPFYWMIVSSLKANPLLDQALVPTSPTLTNYKEVFSSQNNFQYALRNSVIVAGTTTLLALFIGVFSAYALARLQFRAKKLVLGAVLATAMFPLIALLTPLFQLFSDLNLIDTYPPMIIADISFTLPLAIYVLTSFFSEMPWELEMAAKVDGATPGQAFRKVIVPLAAPGVFTAAIIVFIAAWNEFLIAFTMTQTLAAEPVTVAIAKFTGASEFEQPFGTIMAAGVLVTIPLVIVVLIFQRRIVAGLTAGGVKG
jgi:trehalose/maltose transport system permease protein